MTTCSPAAASYVMRRWSLSPPRRGRTHSRYTPSWTTTVSPARASSAARLIVRRGWSGDPSEESDPVVATWNTDAMRTRPLVAAVADRLSLAAKRCRDGGAHRSLVRVGLVGQVRGVVVKDQLGAVGRSRNAVA